MTAEEYIVEDYQAIRLENLMLKKQLEATNNAHDELNEMIWYLLKYADLLEKGGPCRHIIFYTIWEDEDKTHGELFEKVVRRIKCLKKEQSDE